MTKRQISTVLIIGFGLVSWLIISASPTSRAGLWYERSQIYLNAIRSGDLAQTYTQYHPGATTMAVGGASLVALDVLPLPTELLLPDNTTEPGIETAAIVWGQGLVMVGVMVGIAFTLRALTDDVWLPVAAMGLMAFSHYLLSNIRSVHVDAPVALYKALSALLVLVYHQRRQWGWLAASGVAGGLALLTKSPAVFLFPYVGLVLLTLAVEEIMHMQERTVQGLLMTGWRVIVLPLLAWAGVASEDTVISLQQPLRLTWVRFTQLEILLQELGGDYVVLQHNMTVREHRVDEWGHWLDLLEGQDPAAAFVVDGVTYQWLYDVNDPPAETTIYRDGGEGFVPLSWLWFLGTLGVTGAAALQQKQAPATQPQMGQLS
ncbi:MAG: ArnT family glycosyltransferase [Anaerolineae bacterium]